MIDSEDTEPFFAPLLAGPMASRSAAVASAGAPAAPEVDLDSLPWITAEQEPPAPPDGAAGAPPPPPPPSSRGRRPTAKAPFVLGGAADPNGVAEAPRCLITIPKAGPTLRDPLPRVIVPSARATVNGRYVGETLPPRELRAEGSSEYPAEPVSEFPRWHGRAQRLRPVLAVGVLALGGLAVAAGFGVLRSRRGSTVGPSPAPPSFLAAALPASSAPPSIASAGASAAPLVATPPATSPAPDVAREPAPPLVEATAAGATAAERKLDDPSTPPTGSTSEKSLAPASALAASATTNAVPASVEEWAGGKETPPRRPPSAKAHHSGKPGAFSSTSGAAAPRSTENRLATTTSTPQTAARAAAGDSETRVSVDPITNYTFATDRLFAVATAPKRVTELILQPGEKLVTRPTAGDASLWVIHVVDGVQQRQLQQHVQVTPLRAGTSTNLTLTTTRRNYHLELTSSTAGSYMAAVQWRYPADDAARRRQELERLTRERESTAQIADVKALRFDYSIRVTSGEPTWKPTMAFDDGVQTFIRFPARLSPERAPVLFVLRRGEAQNAQYVNYRVRGDLFVVDRLIDTVELRLPVRDEAGEIVRIQRRSP